MKTCSKLFIKAVLIALSGLAVNSFAQASGSSDFNYFSLTDINKGSSKTSPIPDKLDAQSDLYQKILDEMNLEYEQIGKTEAARILQNNSTIITGGLNSIGFSYKRPFVDFSLNVDRNLAPDLFDVQRWIVTDTCSLYIDASKILSNLKDQKIIDISQDNLAAFAGIVFKRTFTWVHYANSYEEGLTTHFEKLFLPFLAMNVKNISKLQSNEMIFKEDSLSVKTGGFVSAPLYTGIVGMSGVLAKFEKLTRVEVVSSPSKSGKGDELHLAYEKSKIASAGASIGIQADFLKILKMTLLSYDFNYELNSSYKIYLNFMQKNLQEMSIDNPVAEEIGQVLKNREGDLAVLAPYVISEEKKISQSIEHKYNFFLLGGIKGAKTQQVEVTVDGRVKTFFRHYYEKIKYTEDFVSRIFSSLIYALTNTDANAAKLASDTKRVEIEYDSDKNLLENHEDLSLKDDFQKLSMSFSSEFLTKKTSGIIGRKYRDRALFLLERFSGIDPLIVTMLQNEYLKAPLVITGKYQVNTEGIRHFNNLEIGEVFDFFGGLCDEYPKNKFFNFRNLFDTCRRALQNDYIDYFKDLTHDKISAAAIATCENKSQHYLFSASKKRAYLKNCLSDLTKKDQQDWLDIPLWQLKTLTTTIVNYSNSKVHYYNLFGVQNVFFYGNLNATTQDGRYFTSSFHEGDFKGFGVVDHYMRLENLRAPSSIVVDQ